MLNLDRMNIKKIKMYPSRRRQKFERVSVTEVTETRQLICQLNWLATQTRPDLSHDISELSYDVSELSSMLKQENVECLNRLTVEKKKNLK